ncbi:HAD family hydrolase [Leptospira ellinghausenii]|nr:HAD family hydrolase [Leptospira ellinghausenii]
MALFLDLDNTILPSKEAYAYAIAECAKDWDERKLGGSFLELYEAARKQVKSQLKHHSSNRLRLLCFKLMWERMRSTQRNGFQTQDIDGVLWMEDRYFFHFLSYFAEEKKKERYQTFLFPLLVSLSKEFPIYLTTNETLRTQLLKVRGFLPDTFRFTLITSEEVGFEKPSKEFFQYVLQRAGEDPTDCILIGDSWEDDILGANSHGISGIHIPEMWGEGDEVNPLGVDETTSFQKDLDGQTSPNQIWRASNTVSGLTFARSRFLQGQK